MNSELVPNFWVPESILQPLLAASNSSSLENSLLSLIESAKKSSGRSNLATTNILPSILHLCEILPYPSARFFLLPSLKLLRNLCAGEFTIQSSFIQENGVLVVSNLLKTVLDKDKDSGIIRLGLQVLGNVSLAGKELQLPIWRGLFPECFLRLSGIRSTETCDVLCMVIYTCFDGNPELVGELCGDEGLLILAEIVHTTSTVGFQEDWFKLVLSRICLEVEGPYFRKLFSKLGPVNVSENGEDPELRSSPFSLEQAFLLRMISEILNERLREIAVPNEFALFIFDIFIKSLLVIDFGSAAKFALPTGSVPVDVLGYSLIILRDICAQGGMQDASEDVNANAVDALLSSGLLELLLKLLSELEPPAIIRKAMKGGKKEEGEVFPSLKPCPYKGFRRDMVAVIGNCAFGRKHVQDEIRKKNGVLLLLQQCVTDEDNPYLREWGIWSVRNILEGNEENQRAVAELELQGSVDVPEIAGLGLRVEIDPQTRRAKLVNVSGSCPR